MQKKDTNDDVPSFEMDIVRGGMQSMELGNPLVQTRRLAPAKLLSPPPRIGLAPVGSTSRRTLEDIRADVIKRQHQKTQEGPKKSRGRRRRKPKPQQSRQDNHSEISLSEVSLRTADISIVSHAHGRQRRFERKILRKELQAAIKYGKKEVGNPGRDGSRRWRYTYGGICFVTDETSRHEITCFRVDGRDVSFSQGHLGGSKCHAVLIIDHSGSMRNSDVPGYESRAHAVYECLKRDFVQEQLNSGAACDDVMVTVISMSNTARVLLHRKPLDESLIEDLNRLSSRTPRSHGNYIPALDKALKVLKDSADYTSNILLLFFSDGAPSDRNKMCCSHGVNFHEINHKKDQVHDSRSGATKCQRQVTKKMNDMCFEKIEAIGQVFGPDKVIFRTVAFGPPGENFHLLENMAKKLPRGEFQKLELNAASLKTSFSSLCISLSTLRTESSTLRTEGASRALTCRSDKTVDRNQKMDIESTRISGEDGWLIYAFQDFIGKFDFQGNNSCGELRPTSLGNEANGIAFLEDPFAAGAERFVYRCSEVIVGEYDTSASASNKADRCGLRLVAKEAKDIENHHRGRSFHETFARIQAEAAELAKAFTARLPQDRPEWNVNFLPTHIYGCLDETYMSGEAWILVEPELDGKFTKWNNNAGEVRSQTDQATLNILEELEESNENDEETSAIQIDDVPQAFSHFSYEYSNGKQLVCDLQGVWNADDGFVLTDPVIHEVSLEGQRRKNGATDQGMHGVKNFFETHVCNELCKRMGLRPRSENTMIPPDAVRGAW